MTDKVPAEEMIEWLGLNTVAKTHRDTERAAAEQALTSRANAEAVEQAAKQALAKICEKHKCTPDQLLLTGVINRPPAPLAAVGEEKAA